MNLKNKLSKQEQRQNHGYRERFDGLQMGVEWGNGWRGEGIKKYKQVVKNSHGDVKYSIGNGVAIELILMTHGHEQWWGDCLRE